MKKIGKLSIKPEKLINNEELVNLKGGYPIQCARYRCQCLYNIGVWEDTYCSTEEIDGDLDAYCEFGVGYCTALYLD